MTAFIIAWEYTGIQQVLFDSREWGHKFSNQSNKHIFLNGIDITVVLGHRGSNNIGNFGRIEFNLFGFKEVLYLVFRAQQLLVSWPGLSEWYAQWELG